MINKIKNAAKSPLPPSVLALAIFAFSTGLGYFGMQTLTNQVVASYAIEVPEEQKIKPEDDSTAQIQADSATLPTKSTTKTTGLRASLDATDEYLLPLDPYYVVANEPWTFQLHFIDDMYFLDEYTKYNWDFDGDSWIDDTTTVPQAEFTYLKSGDYRIRVEAEKINGGIVSDEATVLVRDSEQDLMTELDDGVDRPGPPLDVRLQAQGDSTLILTWKPADDRARYWDIQLDGNPGPLVDIGSGSRVEITELDLSKTVTVRMMGITSDGYRGGATSVRYESGKTIQLGSEPMY